MTFDHRPIDPPDARSEQRSEPVCGRSRSGSPPGEAELIGGPEKRRVVIVASDPAWVRRFDAERVRIVGALGPVALRVDHIGSTAVPGLAAKPIVDIQVSVADVEHEDGYTLALADAGYELRVREPGHRMLRTPERDVHVHVGDRGGGWERRHLLFRDWLRRSPADRRLYAVVKGVLAQRDWATVDDYADAKTEVVADIMERAEAWAQASTWRVDRTERTMVSVGSNGGDGRQDDGDAKRRAGLDGGLRPCHPVVRRSTAGQE
jgi:GrpB-like predicted nucleotidyltransferase (UPF0157 family)